MKTTSQLIDCKDLKGLKVFHGSPCYENLETIESVDLDSNENYAEIIFKSEFCTYVLNEDFEMFLQDGEIDYKRAAGFEALERMRLVEEIL